MKQSNHSLSKKRISRSDPFGCSSGKKGAGLWLAHAGAATPTPVRRRPNQELTRRAWRPPLQQLFWFLTLIVYPAPAQGQRLAPWPPLPCPS